MNAKKVKALRRTARAMSNGAPKVAYQPKKSRVVHRGPIPIPGKDYAIFTGDVRMLENCERAVYKQLKKSMLRSASAS